MQIKINSYITAVDENDPTKGNHLVFSVTKEDSKGGRNTPNLSVGEALKLVETYLQSLDKGEECQE